MAKKLHLTLTCGDYEIMRPLKDGTVEPDGIELTVLTEGASRDRQWRLERNAECEVGEFNVCAFFMARDRGHPYLGLPIYPHRRFRHGFVFANTGKGIERASDLRGRRVGSDGFQPAACVWLRGLLEEFYGLPHRDAIWVVPRQAEIPFTPHEALRIETVAPGKRLEEMLLEGEIDALITPGVPRALIAGDPRIKRLFPDYKGEEIDYYRRTDIFPIMHATMIREDIVEKYPWAAPNLAFAFNQAKRIAYDRVRNPRIVPLAFFESAWEEQVALLGEDPWAYGMGDANRKNLEAAQRYTHEQGLTARRPPLDELFVPIEPGIFRGGVQGF
jgi:4,5-dihydroxyphthalate decarboxylase